MLLGRDPVHRKAIAFGNFRQLCAVFVRFVVLSFLVERKEAVEHGHRAGGAQRELSIAGNGVDGGALEFGALHLTRQRAFPDQFVEPRLIMIEFARHLLRPSRKAGRPDGLMGFLRVLGTADIGARRIGQIARAEILADQTPGVGDGFARHVCAIGAHISNESHRLAAHRHALVQLLRDLHGSLGGEAELARGFLLQRRGDERWGRVPLDGFGFDLAHGEALRPDGIGGALGIRCRPQRQLFEFLAVEMGQPGGERAGGSAQIGVDGPVFLRSEGFDFVFAFADEAQRHRLHAARGTCAGQLAPQHGREGEADKVVECPAREISVHQLFVDVARMSDGVEHGRAGDRVENDALDSGLPKGPLLLEHLQHMPGDRFTFPIGVGGKDQLIGAF